MWFANNATEHPDTLAARQARRPAQKARGKGLDDKGRLLLGGPFPAIEAEDPGPAGFTGSLIVAEFPSLAEAERWAAEDPFVAAGVYANITVKPFRKTLP